MVKMKSFLTALGHFTVWITLLVCLLHVQSHFLVGNRYYSRVSDDIDTHGKR